MKCFGLVLVLLLAPIVAMDLVSRSPAIHGAEEGDKVDTKKIPLDAIYSTSQQKGLKLIDQGQGDEGFREEMRELYQQSIKMGASNIFLVRGDDIGSAVKATWSVF